MAASFLAPILNNPEARWILRNSRSGAIIATTLEAAFDSASRNKGLLGRDALAEYSALILAPCTSIHTFFMRFPIDVLFVRRDGGVTKIAARVPPWRLRLAWGAFAVVELPIGTIARTDTTLGDVLQLNTE